MNCEKEHPGFVRIYTKQWKLVEGTECYPLICDKCNVVWYPHKPMSENDAKRTKEMKV